MERTLEILLIEDTPNHLADARATAESLVASGKRMHVTYVSTLQDAKDILAEREYDGIITDLFFPTGVESDMGLRFEIIGKPLVRSTIEDDYNQQMARGQLPRYELAADEWMIRGATPPSGVLIADYAVEHRIPAVVCTAANHHGYAVEPLRVHIASHKVRVPGKGNKEYLVPMVDNELPDYSKESYASTELGPKNWAGAFEALERVMTLYETLE